MVDIELVLVIGALLMLLTTLGLGGAHLWVRRQYSQGYRGRIVEVLSNRFPEVKTEFLRRRRRSFWDKTSRTAADQQIGAM